MTWTLQALWVVLTAVVRRVHKPFAFAPSAMFKKDVFAYIDPNTLPDLSRAERRHQRRELARY